MKLTDFGPKPDAYNQTMAQVFAGFFRQRPIPDHDVGPRILVSESTGIEIKDWYSRLGWGRMWSRSYGLPYKGEPWGFDNGAWHAAQHGKEFPEEFFAGRVEESHRRSVEIETPPFVAVCPDIVHGGMASLEFSLRWIDRVRVIAPTWKWYLAVQDGMIPKEVDDVLSQFDGIFLGGSAKSKGPCRLWYNMARSHGVLFHYGRCGIQPRLQQAFDIGVDSLDTAGPMMHPHQLEKFLGWVVLLQYDLMKRKDMT